MEMNQNKENLQVYLCPVLLKYFCIIKNSSYRTKDMDMFNRSAIMFIFLTVPNMMGFGHGDTNFQAGHMCSEAGKSTDETSFQANLNTLLSSLSTNVPIQNGFYKTKVGKDSERIYGIIQCRGDISPADCANCASGSIKIALRGCPNSRDVAIWFRWCMLRYSNESIFGVWEKSSIETPTGNGTDDPVVDSKGFAMMTGLSLVTPYRPGMFQTSAMYVGQGGKRYGMAQCRRDISKSDCGKCLDGQLVTFWDQIGNQSRGWDIYGLSCSMWYNDFQFYFNNSILGTSGVQRTWHGGVVAAIVTLTLSIFLSVH